MQGIFCTQLMSRNLIFNTEFKNFIIPGNFQEFSGTLDITWKWPIFCQFWHIGHRFHLIFVTELQFGLDNSKMTNSRSFLESWNQNPKITRDDLKTWHFSSIKAKSKFSDKNQVESMPNMSKLAKNWSFPGDIQSSRKFLEVSRNDEIFKFCVENQVSWHKLSGIYTPHVDISQN